MSEPRRVQLSRKRGWRMPPNTVKVCRPTKWGNPYRVGQKLNPWGVEITVTAPEAVTQFETDLLHGLLQGVSVEDARKQLRGKNLACWCPLDQPCHADVLLRVSNAALTGGQPPQGGLPC